ncbi:MAG TPA: chromosome segregation protein SMC, partial [Gammaproteobacteria bacterium]|nr:chromosome segregation protein SMC [Gammaproteobacteria bacterium]
MADVIFNGSGGRKPVGQASIELIFDNTDGTVSGAYASYAEIAVRRVITRDGTSQYFLNNSRCRRKDITQILLGTGLGSHGYSIIEQGMISRLVDARPEDLRAFLEEAAGISKYKERRRETEHRIRHTRDNLDRLADLREEIDKQLTHLQRQARAAERYKVLKTEERLTTAQLLSLRLNSMRAAVADKSAALSKKQLALDAAITERSQVEAAIDKSRVAHADTVEAFNKVQGDYYRVGADIARLEQAIKHRRELRQRQQEDYDTTVAQLEELRGHVEKDETELTQLDQLLETLNPDVEEAVGRRATAEEALASAEQEMERWRERRDAFAVERAELERSVHVENARMEQLTAQRSRIGDELEGMQHELRELAATDRQSRLEQLLRHEEKVRLACENATHGLTFVTSQITQLREQEKRIVERLDEVRAKLQNDRGRLASLEALQEAALGKATERVDAWLARHDIAANSRLAELLQVEPGWERAVEVVLGVSLQAVHVDDITALAGHLEELGEAGVSLLESGSGDTAAEPQDRLEPLSAYVRAPHSARRLLQSVYAADRLESALAARSILAAGESVITPAGVWLGERWLRVAGRDDPHAGVISRGEEIERIRARVEETARRGDDVGKALTDTRARLEQLETKRVSTQDELNRRQQLLTKVTAQLTSSRGDVDQAQARIRQLERRIDHARRELEEIDRHIETSHHSSQSVTASIEGRQTSEEQLANERAALLTQLETCREEAKASRAHAQELIISIESRKRSKDSASAALQRVRAQQEHLRQRRSELEKALADGVQPLANDEAELSEQLQS